MNAIEPGPATAAWTSGLACRAPLIRPLSWGDWKRQMLVTMALQHMANGSSVQTVALNLGYDSASSFIAMFKRTLGKPPGQYLTERFAKSQHWQAHG